VNFNIKIFKNKCSYKFEIHSNQESVESCQASANLTQEDRQDNHLVSLIGQHRTRCQNLEAMMKNESDVHCYLDDLLKQ
jgi:hypothetical protein